MATDAAWIPAALSRWVDEHPCNATRDPEALMWHRVVKVAEEAGEVTEAMIGYSGGNPRKGASHGRSDIIKELLDVALAALGAVEHLTGNSGTSFPMLHEHAKMVGRRAGLLDGGEGSA